jgi:DNA invertase Pin-like site-specific DNA recombinase
MSPARVEYGGEPALKVVGYLRVSTLDQEHGIDAQRTAILAEAVKRGWTVTWLEDSGRSGKDIDRPGIQAALAMLRARECEALVVSKLDRLSRSLPDFARLLELAGKEGWAIAALDLNLDTSTPTGKLVASIMAAVLNGSARRSASARRRRSPQPRRRASRSDGRVRKTRRSFAGSGARGQPATPTAR